MLVGKHKRKVSFDKGSHRWYGVTLTPLECLQAANDRYLSLGFAVSYDSEPQCVQSIDVYAVPFASDRWNGIMRPLQSLATLTALPSPAGTYRYNLKTVLLYYTETF